MKSPFERIRVYYNLHVFLNYSTSTRGMQVWAFAKPLFQKLLNLQNKTLQKFTRLIPLNTLPVNNTLPNLHPATSTPIINPTRKHPKCGSIYQNSSTYSIDVPWYVLANFYYKSHDCIDFFRLRRFSFRRMGNVV